MKDEYLIDLHVHSCASGDGEFTASELIDKCIKEGVKTMAITDHDTLDSLLEGIEYSREKNIDFIPGIEVLSQHNKRQCHILGYGISVENSEIGKLIENISKSRIGTEGKLFEAIRKYGFYIEEKDVYKHSKTKAILPSAYAYGIFENPKNKNHPDIKGRELNKDNIIAMVEKLFAVSKPLYVEQYIPEEALVIDSIHKSGGVAILAHPGQQFLDKGIIVLDEFKALGIDGFEVYHTCHSEQLIQKYLKYCLEHNMLITCGSDFHGAFKPEISLGCIQSNNNEAVVKKLKESILKYKCSD